MKGMLKTNIKAGRQCIDSHTHTHTQGRFMNISQVFMYLLYC